VFKIFAATTIALFLAACSGGNSSQTIPSTALSHQANSDRQGDIIAPTLTRSPAGARFNTARRSVIVRSVGIIYFVAGVKYAQVLNGTCTLHLSGQSAIGCVVTAARSALELIRFRGEVEFGHQAA
jgi:hypothetical protein